MEMTRSCPTCGARGEEPCIRGSRWGAIWAKGELMPHPHDSRITANKRANENKED